jgi:hypothetical protein
MNLNHWFRPNVLPSSPPMSELAADPLSPSCYHLFPGIGIQESQSLAPDPFLPWAGASPRQAPAMSSGFSHKLFRGNDAESALESALPIYRPLWSVAILA